MIDILDSLAVNTVVEFRNTVLPIMEDLVEKGKIPFICGGTNYYIESLLWKVLIEEAPLKSTHTKRKNSVAESDINKKCKNITEDISGPEKQLSGESEKLLEISQFDFDRDEDETVSTQQLFKLLKQVNLFTSLNDILKFSRKRQFVNLYSTLKQTSSKPVDGSEKDFMDFMDSDGSTDGRTIGQTDGMTDRWTDETDGGTGRMWIVDEQKGP